MTGPEHADAAPHRDAPEPPAGTAAKPGAPRVEHPPDFSFPKAHRVRRKSQYDQILARGEKAVTRHFVCYWTRDRGQGCTLGLIVSRKVGKAVVRNRVKRYLREFFRSHRHQMQEDLQLVVIARPSSARLEFEQCVAALRQCMEQRNVLRG